MTLPKKISASWEFFEHHGHHGFPSSSSSHEWVGYEGWVDLTLGVTPPPNQDAIVILPGIMNHFWVGKSQPKPSCNWDSLLTYKMVVNVVIGDFFGERLASRLLENIIPGLGSPPLNVSHGVRPFWKGSYKFQKLGTYRSCELLAGMILQVPYEFKRLVLSSW